MVIYNHTNEWGFYHYATEKLGGMRWIWDTTLAICCKIGVPLFFMVSGATLIGREESIKKSYKRIPRIIVDYFVFSLLYMCADAIWQGNKIVLAELIKKTMTDSYMHLGFLLLYISFLCSLPILRITARNLDLKSLKYLFISAVVIMSIVPILNYYELLNQYVVPSWMGSSIVVYPILGFALDDHISITKKDVCICGIISLTAIIISLIIEFVYLNTNPASRLEELFLRSFVLVLSCFVFIITKYFCIYTNNKAGRVIVEIGRCVFGVYLIHMFVLRVSLHYLNGFFGNHIGILVLCGFVFLACTGIVYLVRKIPLLRVFL